MHIPLSQQYTSNLVFQLNGIFPYPIYEIHLETSRQFVASIFGIPLMVRIHGNLYLFLVVTSLEYILPIHNNTL